MISAQLWEHFIDKEDLTLYSLHTTLVFQAEDKGYLCPPLEIPVSDLIYIYIITTFRAL